MSFKHHIHRLCVAPMINYTDRHFRYLMRLISPHVFLYTEMISTGALLYGKTQKALLFHESEHPVGIQFGGNDPAALAKCARMAEGQGYDEINLNVGCPSERVQEGEFGASLIEKPMWVADCVSEMCETVSIPVTVKTRLGIGKEFQYEKLCRFIEVVSRSGCQCFIIHARNVWPNLTPAQNRSRPPLNDEMVYQIKKDFPNLEIIINGEIRTGEAISAHLQQVDGVMVGRLAHQNPWFFQQIEQQVFNTQMMSSREEVIRKYLEYIKQEEGKESAGRLLMPLMNLFHGEKNAKGWKQYLSQCIQQQNIDIKM